MALLGLAIVAVPLAAPGPELVPASSAGEPRWLMGLYGEGFGLEGASYLALLAAAFVCYLVVVVEARRLSPRILWGAILGLVGLFVLAPPLLSQDVFSYIAYGRLGAEHGLNPYVAVPTDRAADPILAYVGWRDSVSAYGPLFTLGVYPLGSLSVPAAMWVLKAVSGLAVAALAALSARIAAMRGADPRMAAALVALNPLVLVHVVGGAHNDGLMMAIVMVSVAALIGGAWAGGGAGLVLAAGLKASAGFAAPFALAGERPRGRVLGGMIVAALILVSAALAAFGVHAGDALGLVGENQALTSHYSVPTTLSRLTGVDLDLVRIAALVLLGLAVLGLVRWTIRGGDWVRAAGWAALALLLATSWLLPWYVVWALPFAAVARDRALVAGVIALCGFQLVNRVPL